MDVYAYVKTRMPDWDRLSQLTGKRVSDGRECDEFYRLYLQTSSDLAKIRSRAPDPQAVLFLSAVLARARVRMTTEVMSVKDALARFLLRTLPLSVYRLRWLTLAVALSFLAVSAAAFLTYVFCPQLLSELGTPHTLDEYARHAFKSYYSVYPNSEFAAMVWTNNALIAVSAIVGGFTGIVPVSVLWTNAVAIGQAGAIMHSRGALDVFFGLILPHGIPELCAVFVAGAAGLKIFWVLAVPGNMPRAAALGKEGRQTLLTVFALTGLLFLAGMTEGFVTPSALPWAVKMLCGFFIFVLFWCWVTVFGRRACKAEESADISQAGPEASVEYA